MEVDYLVVGSGLTGATIARCLADRGEDVLILDRRKHLGGNVHDYWHPAGIRIHTYGPHYFRTSSERIWKFINRFATFYRYEAILMTRVDGTLEDWPIQGSYIARTVGFDWRPPVFLADYLRKAIAGGFRLKLTVGTVGAPAGWYLKAHPDARIRNADGEVSANDMSLWYPGLHALLAEKTDRLFGYIARLGLVGATDFVFVDLGPASEPLYPAPGTMGETQTHGPWFYDEHAESAFARAVRQKYPSLVEANRSWATNFTAWQELRLPRPGEHPGGLWHDALLWYRDSKRRFVRWQVANYQRALRKYAPAGARTRLIIMVPGSHTQPAEWRRAERSGNPDYNLTIMTDSEFLLDLSKATDCWLQYTGVENEKEVAYLRSDGRSSHARWQCRRRPPTERRAPYSPKAFPCGFLSAARWVLSDRF